ncbi:MAG TPA: carboxypeptidase regulatory-like domain-containing protein [Pseudacidobacterium sp.]|nr:carboxypeptidase regulatory-like domain-containing protein [Pseudacidobacterium sp.]
MQDPLFVPVCKRTRLALAVLVIIVCFASLSARAQLTTATILGTITDPSGSVVPGAQVTAMNVDTKFTRTVSADASGNYRLEFLPIGKYELKVEAPGFKSYSQFNITLNLNDQLRNDVVLAMGSTSETVTVTAAPSLIQSSASSLGRLVDNVEVDNLPIVGRNIYDLLTLTAGVQSSTSSNVLGFPQQVVYINGGTDNFVGSVSYYLDGGLNMTMLRNTGNILPNPDALQEFHVETNNYNALFGRMSAGLVNVVTKSGTNRFHGSIFEFLRNDKLNATPAFASGKSSYHRNQFGATLGGPIIHDKTFFFGTYGGLRQSTPSFLNGAVVPTAAERTGDFSADLPPELKGTSYTCKSATAADKAAGFFVACNPLTKQPFPNNVVDTPLDPTAQAIINKYIPLPNTVNRNSVSNPLSMWSGYSPAIQNTDEFLIKVDHNLTPSQRLEVSYFNTSGIQQQIPGGNILWSQQNYNWRQQNANVSDTWTISASKINQIWVNYTRMLAGRLNTPGISLHDLGSSFSPQGTPSLPQITVSGYFTLSQSIAGPEAGTNFYSLRDVFSWNKGAHAFSFGGEASLNKDVQQTLLDNYGVFTFDGSRAITSSGASSSQQNGLVDFVLGLPKSMEQDAPVTALDNMWFYGLFLQDDYKIKPNLTLNLGIRWDVQQTPTDPQNRMATFVPGVQSTVIPNAPTGLLFPGDLYDGHSRLPRSIVSTPYHHVSPRVGFAWDPYGNGHTAVRGAAGLFYGMVSGNEFNGMSNFLPFAVRNTYSFISSLTDVYSDPRSFPDGNPYPYVFSPSNARFIYPASLQGIDRNYQWPYAYQFNFSVQQQIARDFAVTMSYVGTLSHDVPFAPDINYPIWSPTATASNYNARRPYFPTGSATPLTTVYMIQSKQRAHYHGLQIDFEKRMGHGFSVKGFYIWSKTMTSASVNNSGAVIGTAQNFDDLGEEYGRGDEDVRHRSQTSIVWQPNYFNSRGPLVRGILDGWTFSAIVGLQSGSPFSITTGVDSNFDGNNNDRTSFVPGVTYSTGAGNRRSVEVKRYFNPAAFCGYSNGTCLGVGPGGSDGDTQRMGFTGPGSKNVNAALFRNFKLFESVQLQGRVEATNIFNMVNLNNPVSSINNGTTVGTITGAGTMRQLQVGARILF